MSFHRTEFELPFEPLSLAWMGDQLVDPLRYTGSDLREIPARISSHPISCLFDAGIVSASGIACAYQRLGTKAVVERRIYSQQLSGYDRTVGCELDRSCSYAEITPFPMAFVSMEYWDDAIVFAPNIDRLRIVDLTGKTIIAESDPVEDYFHGRLEVSHSGRWLLSDGWIWHPRQARMVIDLNRVREDPRSLNNSNTLNAPCYPLTTAWLSDDTLAMAPFCLEQWNEEIFDYESFEPWQATLSSGSVANSLFILDPESGQILRQVQFEFEPRDLVAWGTASILSKCPFPRIADLATGKTIAEFPELAVQTFDESWYPCNIPSKTPFACHSKNACFAYARGYNLTVVSND